MSGFRLSPQQRRLFELSAVGGERLTAGAAFRITGELDLDRFRHAVALLLERFEILTTGFPRVPGLALPVQRPGARVDAEVACAAVDSLAQGERAWRRLFPASEPVADAPPPVRLLLESRGEREHLLVWTQPALLGDAASLGNQVDELLRLYRSTDSPGSGDADPGAEPPLQYADLAEWLNEVVEDEAAAEGPAFWEARSGAATPPPFPLLRADVGERFEPRLCPLPLTADTQAALRRHATDLGLELEALLHAAWAALLTRYADGAPLSVDTDRPPPRPSDGPPRADG